MTVTKAHAWVAWKYLAYCSGDSSPTSVKYDVLEPYLFSRAKTTKALEEGTRRDRKGQMDRPAEDDILRLRVYFETHLTSVEVQKSFKNFAGSPMSLRAFFCAVWTTCPESDIENCMKWCGLFQAKIVLEELLDEDGDGRIEDVAPGDVDAIFAAIDVNGDGEVSMEELINEGGFSEQQASKLMEADRSRGGALDLGELRAAANQTDAKVSESLRGMFARGSMQHGKEGGCGGGLGSSQSLGALRSPFG